MNYLITILIITISFILIWKSSFFKHESVPDALVYGAYIIKLFAALALVVIYTYFYNDRASADIFKYFDDAKGFARIFAKSPSDFWTIWMQGMPEGPHWKQYYDEINYWSRFHSDIMFNDNKTIISILFLLQILTLGNYAPMVIICCFISFAGLTGIYRFIAARTGKPLFIYMIVFFLPSTLLWTSGILKEAFLIGFLGMFLYHLDKISDKKPTSYVFILISFCGLALLKYYVLIALLPGVVILLWHTFAPSLHICLKTLIVTAAIISGILLNHYFLHIYPLFEAVTLKHNDFVRWVEEVGNVGSYIPSEFYEPTLSSLLLHFPESLFNVIFRPLPWNIKNIIMIVPALENIILLTLCIFAIALRDKNNSFNAFSAFALVFTFFLFGISGLVSPVVGALVRYKVPALPFLFSTLLYFTDISKIPVLRNINKLKQ